MLWARAWLRLGSSGKRWRHTADSTSHGRPHAAHMKRGSLTAFSEGVVSHFRTISSHGTRGL